MTPVGLLLCTDLDRTLLPNGTEPESPRARPRFRALASRPDVCLVYVTGRDRRRVEQAVSNYALPTPAFVVSDVGTNIYDLRAGRWDPSPQWRAEIGTHWNGYAQRDLLEMLREYKMLRLQEHDRQDTFKLSYYVPLHACVEELGERISARLGEKGIGASLLWSVDEPARIGLLDIIPEHATKLHAVQFIRRLLGVDLGQTLFAGDSGNDLAVLASGVPSVLVRNAAPSVTEQVLALTRDAGNESTLYVARGGFLEMNGNYAAGILEGVAHYHPGYVEVFAEDPLPG